MGESALATFESQRNGDRDKRQWTRNEALLVAESLRTLASHPSAKNERLDLLKYVYVWAKFAATQDGTRSEFSEAFEELNGNARDLKMTLDKISPLMSKVAGGSKESGANIRV